MNKFQEYLANNIKSARKRKKLTQMQLADLCETSTNYIGLMETAKRFPSVDMLEKIANALELKPQELFAEPIGNLKSGNRKERILARIVEVLDEEFYDNK